MKWFSALPENDKNKFGAFFNDVKHFPPAADGRSLARMKEERFVAILGDALGADLYEELQKLKGKGAAAGIESKSVAYTWHSRCVHPCCCGRCVILRSLIGTQKYGPGNLDEIRALLREELKRAAGTFFPSFSFFRA